MNNPAEIITYTITITRQEYHSIMNSEVDEENFWLGYVMAKAEPQYIYNKDVIIEDKNEE